MKLKIQLLAILFIAVGFIAMANPVNAEEPVIPVVDPVPVTETPTPEPPAPENPVPEPPTPPKVPWNAKELRCLSGVQVNGARGMGKGTVRYGGKYYKENTIVSDWKVVSIGACGFEGDIRGAAGSCVVRNHDSTLRRVQHRSGRVAAMSCAALARVGVPSFEQTVNGMANRSSCFGVIEIKSISKTDLTNKMKYAASKLKSPECLRFTSASKTHLSWVKSIDKRFPTGLITFSNSSRPSISSVPSYVDMIMVHYSQATPYYVNEAKQHGKDVSARAVTTKSIFDRVKRAGVNNVNGSIQVVKYR